MNPYKFLNQQLESVQAYPLGDGLDILKNLTEYLEDQANKPLIESLYTAFIYKYPTKDSVIGLNETEIEQIMWAYDKQARLLHNNGQFIEASNLYSNAEKINPNHFGCLFNHALHLQIQAESAEEKEHLIAQSIEQYRKCIKISKDSPNTLRNLSDVLLKYAQIKNDKKIYREALETLQEGLIYFPDHTYNLACYYALTNNIDASKENLLHSEQLDTLPPNPFKHLSKDKDLDNVRNEQWFIELLDRLKAKEEAEKVA